MTKKSSFLISFLLRLLTAVVLVYAQTDDYYCGYSWDDATLQCLHPCPSGADSDCSYETTGVVASVASVAVAGDDTTESGAAIYGCYFFTGCKVKIDNGLIVTQTLSPAPSIVGGGGEEVSKTMPLEELESGSDDDVVQNWLSTSPTIIISSVELLRLELIFSLMNIMSTIEIDTTIDTFNTTMFNYITDVLTLASEKIELGQGGGEEVAAGQE